jgi:hypothetical protein
VTPGVRKKSAMPEILFLGFAAVMLALTWAGVVPAQ